jgi:two-component system nitrogen regulation response regulator GlnG
MDLLTETRSAETLQGTLGPLRVPGLTVLWHPDPERIGERSVLPELEDDGGMVELSRLSPLFSPPDGERRRPLEDSHLSRRPILLRRRGGVIEIDPAGSPMAAELEGEPLTAPRRLPPGEPGVVLTLSASVALLLHELDPLPATDLPSFGLIGQSAGLQAIRRDIQSVADLEVAVLVRGESGSGKELVARALHEASPRRHRPFVAVNLAAVPPALAAAELFGAARGAYTGADRARPGHVVRADGGTLFLDEIGEAPVEVQVALLRMLETGRVQAVGGEADRPVDVRVIAATDADLESAIADGRFREPLLHRLAGFVLRLPPLRARRDDFGLLLLGFLRQELAALGETRRLDGGSWLPASLAGALARLPWPGNVRQLRNTVRQIAIANRTNGANRGGDGLTLPEEVAVLLAAGPGPPDRAPAPEAAPPRTRTAYRHPSSLHDDELLDALRRHRWRLKPAAAELGVSRGNLYRLLESHPRLRKAGDLGGEEIAAHLERAGGDLDAAAADLEVSREGLLRRMHALGLR